jgi:L,D-transpeptidase ErfK/SrfK
MNKKHKHVFLNCIFSGALLFISNTYALTLTKPSNNDKVLGEVKTAIVNNQENFSAIAQQYDAGYYEVYEANPGVNPDYPPNGSVLIIPSKVILPLELEKDSILINLAEMRLYYEPKDGKNVYIFPVGIGKEDWETPTGTLKIVEKTVDPTWVVPDSIYKFRVSMGDKIPHFYPPGPDNPLGKYALRLSLSTYLIHGTNMPEGVGRRSSGGCIRLYPNDIELLFHMVRIGTKVTIVNVPYKAAWQNGKIYLESHMPLLEQRLSLGEDVTPAVTVVEAANKGHNAKIDIDKITKVTHEHLGIPIEVGEDVSDVQVPDTTPTTAVNRGQV